MGNIFLFAIVTLFLPVSLIILYTAETLENIKRKKQGLPPKKHHDITDFDVIDIIIHDSED